MTEFIFPRCQIDERRGAILTVTSGDLPEFPKWFEDELRGMMERLYQEAQQAKRKTLQPAALQRIR